MNVFDDVILVCKGQPGNSHPRLEIVRFVTEAAKDPKSQWSDYYAITERNRTGKMVQTRGVVFPTVEKDYWVFTCRKCGLSLRVTSKKMDTLGAKLIESRFFQVDLQSISRILGSI